MFQIGWIIFKLRGLPRREEIETARAIFERVLEIENDNVCARFALASLTLVFGPCSFDQEYDEIEHTPLPFLVWEHEELFGSRQDLFASDEAMQDFVAKYNQRSAEYLARKRASAWNELPGEHLRAAMEAGGPQQALWFSRTRIGRTDLEVDYYCTASDVDRLLEHWWTLGDVLPECDRLNFYNVAGIQLPGNGVGEISEYRRWFEKAIRYESSNPEDSYYAYAHLGESWLYSKPRHILGGMQGS